MIPIVLFAFDHPENLDCTVNALRTQAIERLIVYVDGPRNGRDLEAVERCRQIARAIDWVDTELHFGKDNKGFRGLGENITEVFKTFPAAIFVEEDCIPMPGFNSYMTQALAHYQSNQKVFSIGGYQPIEPRFLRHSTASFVSSARFTRWGWATWRDRWEFITPYMPKCYELFRWASDVPETAGQDLPQMVRWEAHDQPSDWDWQVTLTTLWLRQVHLLPTKGLIRNFGQGGRQVHTGQPNVHNCNVSEAAPGIPSWLEDVEADHDYAKRLKEFVHRATAETDLSLQRKAHRVASKVYWQVRAPLGKAKRAISSRGKTSPPRFYDVVLEEAAHQAREKRALVSFIADRFAFNRDDPRFLQHMVIWFAHELVRSLNRLGYSVDVVGYQDREFLPRREYDLFVGHMGLNFVPIAQTLPLPTPKIYLSTTNYWHYHNCSELARLAALKERRGIELPLTSDRFLHYPEEDALLLANGVLTLGNEFTRKTYSKFSPVFTVDSLALADTHFDTQEKDYNAGRYHFLFYGGPGNVHKGLDLLLEAFGMLGKHHLWICTEIEEHFASIYRTAIDQSPNIHVVGWVEPRSAKFYEIIDLCNFAIMPSCSETGPQSVVECMNQGLIPLVSRASALDVGGCGVFIEPCTIDEIIQVVRSVSELSTDKCRTMSLSARQVAITKYSEHAFSQRVQQGLESILQAIGTQGVF